MNVSLPAELKDWVDKQVKTGGYGTASEYLRDVLRRTRERQLRRQIEESVMEAIESGAVVAMDDADWDSIRRAARAQASKSTRRKR